MSHRVNRPESTEISSCRKVIDESMHNPSRHKKSRCLNSSSPKYNAFKGKCMEGVEWLLKEYPFGQEQLEQRSTRPHIKNPNISTALVESPTPVATAPSSEEREEHGDSSHEKDSGESSEKNRREFHSKDSGSAND
ncbi:hypothetical protein HAX54_047033 [Datura stramonium]|uniref:Uncharacterized protein n=1 Tax=Datura stramonium TaxID=4076 RepID=A0ABS8WJU9_DATST|nr:hypothetical protein [Datura stramonium]